MMTRWHRVRAWWRRRRERRQALPSFALREWALYGRVRSGTDTVSPQTLYRLRGNT